MTVKLLGLLDIFAGIAVGLLIFGSDSFLIVVAGLYLIAKSIIFFGGASFVDLLIGCVILYSLLTPVSVFLLIVITLWLVQKGVFSITLT